MSVLRARTVGWAPRRRSLVVSSPNQRSIRLIQLLEVGVKWRTKRGCCASHRLIFGVLWVELLSSTRWTAESEGTWRSMVGWPGASQPPAPSDPGVTVSRHRALLTGRQDDRTHSQWAKRLGSSCLESGPTSAGTLCGLAAVVFLPGPAPQVEADAPQEGIERRPVVPAVVVHPPGDDWVQPRRQVVQGEVGAPVYPQFAEVGAFGLERLGADRWQERAEVRPGLAVDRLPWPEGVPEEGEQGVLVLTRAGCCPCNRQPASFRDEP